MLGTAHPGIKPIKIHLPGVQKKQRESGSRLSNTDTKIDFREASHIDFVHEKRHMDVLLESPPPPLETSRTFFDSAEASEALFIVQASLRLRAMNKSIKVHMGQGQD